VDWNFGTFIWSMVVFFFWFAVIWAFITIFADIFRRDMSGWAKAGWIVLITLLPFVGILCYLISRPRVPMASWGATSTPRSSQRTPGYGAADEIAKAAQLHDQGRISDDEYEQLKEQALSHSA